MSGDGVEAVGRSRPLDAVAQGARGLWGYRGLLANLVTMEVRIRYRRMGLGRFWALANPVAMILVYWLAFRFVLGIIDIDRYPLFITIGVLHWTLWSQAIVGSCGAVLARRDLIRQVSFPRSLVPLGYVGGQLVEFGFAVAAFVVLSAFLGVHLWLGLIAYPIVLALSVLMITGAALALSALNVFFRDLQEIVSIAMRVGFFASPVLYSFDRLSPAWQTWLGRLPFAPFLDALRDILYHDQWPAGETWLLMFLWSGAVAALGGWIFHRTRTSFAEWF